MTKGNMKRKIAAMLCMAMMSGMAVPFAAAESTPAEALSASTEPAAPQYTKIQISAEAVDGSIVVHASGMAALPLCAVLDGVRVENMNGAVHTFSDVAAGEHTVQVRYAAPDVAAFASQVITVVAEAAPQIEAPQIEVQQIEAQQAEAPAAQEIQMQLEPLVLEVAPVIGGTRPQELVEMIVPAPQPQEEPEAPLTVPVIAGSAADPVTSTETLLPETPSDLTAKDAEPVFSEISAQVTVGADSITITIVEASSEAMYAAVGEDWKEGLHKGDTVTFGGLTAGEYEIEIDYENGTNVLRTTATVGAQNPDGGSDTVAPPAGDASGTGSGSDTVTPPAGDTSGAGSGADAVAPPAGDTTGAVQTVKAFAIVPAVSGGAISVTVSGASEREVEVLLLDKDGKTVAKNALIGSGTVKLGEFSTGTYTVRAQYVTPVQASDGSYDFKTVTAQAVVGPGITGDPADTTPVNIKAKFEAGKDYIIVTITESADAEMYVAMGGFEPKLVGKDGSVRFDGLTPGTKYDLEIDYVNPIQGTTPCRGTVTIEKPAVLSEIAVTAVVPGVNKLTVSGTATPGQQLVITTTPAAAGNVYAVAGDNGAFSVDVPCAAGTYTAVTAKYVADASVSRNVSGSWAVTAPAAKPTLTVDAIDTTSTTVVAKTTAGVIVELRTGDYTQKVAADESGILRFSLPHTYAAGTKLTFVVYYGDGLSFTQEAVVAAVPYLGTLKYGDKGDTVKTLTARLAALGYPVDETSRYGSTVREAVRLFQRANGLDDDGIAGPKTQRLLFSVSAIAYGAGQYPTLVRGDRGYALIYTLQQRLKDLGYYTIKVDGIFGSGTQRAVREFQRINGLTVTGKADNATQTLLYSSAAKPAESGVTGDYSTLSRSGKYKSKVVPLQRRLKELGYYSGNVDGYFGSQTYRAVRNFQSRNSLTVTGVADPYTQQVLYSASAKAASGSSSSSSSSSTSGYRLLYWGCRGDAVKKLQQALIDAGYKSIVRSADGIFGQWTYDAVRAYQKDKGLAVDGIAGKNTQNALYGTKY